MGDLWGDKSDPEEWNKIHWLHFFAVFAVVVGYVLISYFFFWLVK